MKYKQSVLGVLWAVIQPLSMMAVFTFIFSFLIKMPSDGIPYPIFSYTALLPWTFFAAALSFAIPSVVANASLVTKIYLPREIFPFSAILAAFFDFCIASVIFVFLMLFYRVPLSWNVLYLLPILVVQIFLTLGVGLFASALNVYYRDVKYILPLGLQLWMYASPVIYPISVVPEKIRVIYMLNPMSPIIDSYRKVLLLGTTPDFACLGFAAVVSLVVFVLGYKYFKKVEMSFADVI
ncbi:ABC transporter permease [Patescibacteria group bacterium]|nr:ABC transporter permease [Patescibacteria group bacterium]